MRMTPNGLLELFQTFWRDPKAVVFYADLILLRVVCVRLAGYLQQVAVPPSSKAMTDRVFHQWLQTLSGQENPLFFFQ